MSADGGAVSVPHAATLTEDATMSRSKKPASQTPHDDSGDGGKESVESVLTAPATDIDPDWRERIDIAKRARQDGKKLREGKPITFRTTQPLRPGGSLS